VPEDKTEDKPENKIEETLEKTPEEASEETKKKEKGFVDKLWDSLASVKLAIIIFALIGLTSMIGTIIEQNGDPNSNMRILAKVVGLDAAPATYELFVKMGFMDMYKSWWFNGLLALFAVNLIICSIDRFPPRWRMVKKKIQPLKETQFKTFPIKREFQLKGTAEDAKAQVLKGIGKLGFKKPGTGEEDGHWQAYAQRQVYSRIGVYITHLSIIVIMVGALIGFFFGFKGYLNIPEGQTYSVAFARKNVTDAQYQERNKLLETLGQNKGNSAQAARALGVSEERYLDRLKFLGVELMDFYLKNETFEVSFYGQTYQAKEYSTLLTVFENNKPVVQKRIEVNTPLKHKGYTFYQSSYGPMEDTSLHKYIFNLITPSGTNKKVEVKLKETFEVPDTELTLSIERFLHTAQFDSNGQGFPDSRDSVIMANQAVQVKIAKGDKYFLKWVLKRYPKTWEITDGVRMEFVDVWGAEYTGLQVRRDPGVWIVYLGCLIMGIGLYFAFFMSHRRIWISVAPSGRDSHKVTLAASAHKGREGLERNIDQTITLLTEGGK